jgi:DUF971 family protein/molybdopterin converting factor small subunit
MSEQPTRHHPTEISLHRKSRVLLISFDDGSSFELPCEYLRVFSRAAEVRVLDQPVTGKEQVNIQAIEPQGQYAVRLVFDDGHDTGIYSWDSLYELGCNKDANWQAYLTRLQQLGYARQEPDGGRRQVKLLYFAYLVKKLRREAETLELPPQLLTVADLLSYLGRRKPGAAPLFAEGQVRVTVNRQFAEPFTRLEDGDEIGLVPSTPTPPPTPDLI